MTNTVRIAFISTGGKHLWTTVDIYLPQESADLVTLVRDVRQRSNERKGTQKNESNGIGQKTHQGRYLQS